MDAAGRGKTEISEWEKLEAHASNHRDRAFVLERPWAEYAASPEPSDTSSVKHNRLKESAAWQLAEVRQAALSRQGALFGGQPDSTPQGSQVRDSTPRGSDAARDVTPRGSGMARDLTPRGSGTSREVARDDNR